MCTIIVAHGVVDEVPLLLGANRDELYARPSAPPRLFEDGGLRVVAPQDLKAGGTWLGINAAGVVVAITNRFASGDLRAPRSRGELVFRALNYPTVERAAAAVMELRAGDYQGFHLVIASARRCELVWGDGHLLSRAALPASSVSVITERSMGAALNRRKLYVKRQVDRLAQAGELDAAALEQVLSRRHDGHIDATCVALADVGYGTRSSTIIGLGPSPMLRFADGAPGEVAYRDETTLLDALFD